MGLFDVALESLGMGKRKTPEQQWADREAHRALKGITGRPRAKTVVFDEEATFGHEYAEYKAAQHRAAREAERPYIEACVVDGQRYERQLGEEEWVGIVYPTENKIKPTVHKAGHFPIAWMIEAYSRATASEMMITIQLEYDGVVVIGQEGDNYETHILTWASMEHAPVNPVILGIETVERHISTLSRLKDRVG